MDTGLKIKHTSKARDLKKSGLDDEVILARLEKTGCAR
jgi:hypothetical protein